MIATAVNQATSPLTGAKAAASKPASQLGQNEFMRLLVAQLANQDPLEPQSGADFIGQLAQFASLESMQKLNSGFADLLFLQQLSQGANLVGQNVIFEKPDAGGSQTGIVDSVQVLDGKLQLLIGDNQVSLQEVRGVGPRPSK